MLKELLANVDALEKAREQQPGPSTIDSLPVRVATNPVLRDLFDRVVSLKKGAQGTTPVSVPMPEHPTDRGDPSPVGESPVLYGVEHSSVRHQVTEDCTPSAYLAGCYASGMPGVPPVMGSWGAGSAHSSWLQASAGQVWRGAPPIAVPVPGCGTGGIGTPWWVTIQNNPAANLPYAYMERSLPLGDHLLPSTKIKIWRGNYINIFMLLFRDVEIQPGAKDNPRELEKIKRQHVDKNFANWLLVYTIYMGMVLQVQPEWGLALAQYLDLIHWAYRKYAGAIWLRYDEMFRTWAAMDPSLPWDCEHHQLWSQCMGPSVAISGWYTGSGHLVVCSASDHRMRNCPEAVGSILPRLLGVQQRWKMHQATL